MSFRKSILRCSKSLFLRLYRRIFDVSQGRTFLVTTVNLHSFIRSCSRDGLLDLADFFVVLLQLEQLQLRLRPKKTLHFHSCVMLFQASPPSLEIGQRRSLPERLFFALRVGVKLPLGFVKLMMIQDL